MRFQEYPWAEKGLYVFVDDDLVEGSFGVQRVFHPLEKEDAVLMEDDSPWEGFVEESGQSTLHDPFQASILYDNKNACFVCWYLANSVSAPYQVCCAISKDGFKWEKPPLGKVVFRCSDKNNIIRILNPSLTIQDFGGIVPNYLKDLDANLVCSVFSEFPDKLYFQGITFASSLDGLDWNPRFPPGLPYDGDNNNLTWNPNEECYLLTTRSYQHANIYGRLGKKVKRHIALGKSRDLLNWTPLITVLEPDEKDPPNMEFYGMYVIPYGHGYIGLLETFDVHPSLSRGPCEVQCVFSRDLLSWQRVGNRVPFIARGRKESWDSGMVSPAMNAPFPEGEKIRFWYGGKKGEHWQYSSAGLGTGTLRRDGFVSWETKEEGYIVTCPLKINWATTIFLNIEAPKGAIEVEVLDAKTNKPLPGVTKDDCLPITGNHLRAPVEFKNERGRFLRHTGEIKFKFYLKNAKIYAFKTTGVSF